MYLSPYPLWDTTTGADEYVPSLFVNEFVEILMDNHKWNAGHSDGEGFSLMAGHLLHPLGDPSSVDIDAWMKDQPSAKKLPSHTQPRQDWVNNTFEGEHGVHGDWDEFSYGCAELFMFYLKSQLGFSMEQIVQSPAGSLGARYKHLMKTSADGFVAFRDLLQQFYPWQVASTPNRVDLFPLGGRFCIATAAGVIITDPKSRPGVARSGTAARGTMCGTGEYHYTLYNLRTHLRVTAYAQQGFGHPVVKWTINTRDVPPLLPYESTTLPVKAMLTAVDPTKDSTPMPNQDVQLTVQAGPAASPDDMSTYIDIFVDGHPGNVQFRIDVVMTDEFATDPENTATTFAMNVLPTQHVVWEDKYRRDSEECWNRYNSTHNRPLPWLRRYLPDPSPELLTAASILDELRREARELAATDPKLAEQIDKSFGGHLLSPKR